MHNLKLKYISCQMQIENITLNLEPNDWWTDMFIEILKVQKREIMGHLSDTEPFLSFSVCILFPPA